jgi:hypothetical protein
VAIRFVVADDSIGRLRILRRLPSLEDIFAELTEERDPAAAEAQMGPQKQGQFIGTVGDALIR